MRSMEMSAKTVEAAVQAPAKPWALTVTISMSAMKCWNFPPASCSKPSLPRFW